MASRSDQLAAFLSGGFQQGGKAIEGGWDSASREQIAKAGAGDHNLDRLLKLKQLQSLEGERTDRAVERFSGNVEKSGIPQATPALQAAEKSFKGKSVGPIMNVLPEPVQGVAANVKSRLGEFLGKKDWQGSGEEFQDLSRLRNIDVRQFAGAAQTQAETAKQMIEKGMQAGGSPDQVRQGMQMMRTAMQSHAKNIEAGTRPAALAEYERRGGIRPSQQLAPEQRTAGADDQRRARLEELRRKKAGM